MLDMDTLTITVARGLLSPLLLPNTDTDTTLMAILDSDTTDTITARDLLSPPLSPDTPTTLMPPILMPTMATMVILMAVMVITTKFCCLTIQGCVILQLENFDLRSTVFMKSNFT